MASLDIWLEGDWGSDCINFTVPVLVNMERMHYDDEYLSFIHRFLDQRIHEIKEELESVHMMLTQV